MSDAPECDGLMWDDPACLVWHDVPCKCGYTVTDMPEEFEWYDMPFFTYKLTGEVINKWVKRCKTCKEVCLISREPQ